METVERGACLKSLGRGRRLKARRGSSARGAAHSLLLGGSSLVVDRFFRTTFTWSSKDPLAAFKTKREPCKRTINLPRCLLLLGETHYRFATSEAQDFFMRTRVTTATG